MKKSKMAGGRRPKAERKQDATVGQRVIEGLDQAIEWSHAERGRVRVTVVTVPEMDVRKVRRQMGLSQTQFATKFGFPPATLRNWEQRRGCTGRTDASTAGRNCQAS